MTTVLADLLAWSWLIALAILWLLTPTGTRGDAGCEQIDPPAVGAPRDSVRTERRRRVLSRGTPLNAALSNARPFDGPLLPERGGPRP